MKKQILIERIFQLWAFSLMAMTIASFAYATFQLATGNIQSTAAFEF